MELVKLSNDATVWLLVPDGKIALSSPAELLELQSSFIKSGKNPNVTVINVDGNSNVGNFIAGLKEYK